MGTIISRRKTAKEEQSVNQPQSLNTQQPQQRRPAPEQQEENTCKATTDSSNYDVGNGDGPKEETSKVKEDPEEQTEEKEEEHFNTDRINENKETEEEKEKEQEEEEKPKIPLKQMIEQILNGDIDIELPSTVRIVRIFTSSTFTDTFHERNALMVKIYPKLKEYCQAQGFDFQVVDMRWGIRDEATADHMTSELCMKELKACQQMSTGPNFITFLGQKYGYRPFPPKIAAKEFDAMLAEVKEETDIALLRKWFLLDENSIPPIYILQPITDLLPNYKNQSVSKEERSEASTSWWDAFERMQVVFRGAASKALNENAMWKYYMSVTEYEITRGILQLKHPSKHCYWFKRNITNLYDYISKSKDTAKFVDMVGDKLDAEANCFVEKLRLEKIPNILPEENISVYDVDWHGDEGINPNDNKQHTKYIDVLCKDFYRILVQMIDSGIKEREQQDIDDNLINEICQHAKTCHEKSHIFHGHEDVLEKISTYLEGSFLKPLVVHGPSGCGKTAVMAKAAQLSKEKHAEKIQVTRFLGTTSDSSTLAKLLYSICCQIQRARRFGTEDIPTSTKHLTEYLKAIFKALQDQESHEVIIFLDSIDQLSPDDGVFLMKWLPTELPECIKIVISTLPDEQFKILRNLKLSLPDQSFVEAPKLPLTVAKDILAAWLKDQSRQLTADQTEIVMNAFNKCPLPLFLKLCFDEAVRWKSYTNSKDTVLQSNIKDAINTLFSRLERLHGKELVSHALGKQMFQFEYCMGEFIANDYLMAVTLLRKTNSLSNPQFAFSGLITSSQHGLSDAEIDDVLSIDDEVLNDVYQYWTPPVRRIPPLLWLRIRADLGSYIVSRGANGTLVNMWYHRQFIETATERYLSPSEKRNYHILLSEYFLGDWSNNKRKPFVTKNGESDVKDRLVSAQPNTYLKQDGSDGVFNYRKLSELPHHLISSQNIEALKLQVLFNFDFLLSKLRAFGHQYLLEDLARAADAFPGDKEIKLVHEFLKLSVRTLLHHPDQLPCQITGRMLGLNTTSIKSLIEQAKSANVACGYALQKCFDAPGGPLVNILAGHESQVDVATLSLDKKKLFSAAADKSIRVWDLAAGRLLKSMELDQAASGIYPVDDSCAVVVTYFEVILKNLYTEEVYSSKEHPLGYNDSDLSYDRKHFLVLNYDGIIVFNCVDEKLEVKYEIEEANDEDGSFVSDILKAGLNQYVYTRGQEDIFFVRRIKDKDFKKEIKPPHHMVFFSFNEEGDKFILLCVVDKTQHYKQTFLYVYDASSWTISKSFEANDFHANLCDTRVSVVGNEFIWTAVVQINFWNFETGRERSTLKQGDQGKRFRQAICPDDKTMITNFFDNDDNVIEVYDLDLLEFSEATSEVRETSDLEKERTFVDVGEREMFSHPTGNIAVSILPMDSLFRFWDTSTFTLQKVFKAKNVHSTAMMFVDDRHLVIWEHNKKCLLTMDYIDGKFIAATPQESLCDYPPTLKNNTWVSCVQTSEILMFDPGRMYFVLYDWKTGRQTGEIKTDWKKQGQDILYNSDGSVILACENDNEDYEKSIPLMLFDTVKRQKIGELKPENKRFNMTEEGRCITEDARFFVCISLDHRKVNVWDLSSFKIIQSLSQKDEDDYGEITSLSASTKAKCLIVCFTIKEKRNDDYAYIKKFVLYKLETWEKLTEIRLAGTADRYDFTADGMKFMVRIDRSKSFELFDLSKVNDEKKIVKLASVVPETVTRFSYIGKHSNVICLGLSGIDGIAFFLPCGVEGKLDENKMEQVTEIKIDCHFYPKTEEIEDSK